MLLRRLPLIASVVAWWLAPLAIAQQRFEIPPRTDSPPQNRTVVQVESFDGSRRRGGEGFVRIAWRNGDREPHELRVELSGDDMLRVTAPPIAMAPESEGSLWLRVPRTGLQLDFTARLETGAGLTGTIGFGRSTNELGVLIVDGRADASRRWAELPLQLWQARGGTGEFRAPDAVSPAALPPDWRVLTGYDVVVVHPGDPELTDETVTWLLDAVRAGGRLLVAGPVQSAPAALQQIARSPSEAEQRLPLGLGQVVWHNSERVVPLEVALAVLSLFAASQPESRFAGPIPPEHYDAARIEDVAPLPSNLFFAIVLGYALLAGPIGLRWFRRGGRPWLALIVVPAAGLAVTALILGISTASEGGTWIGSRHTLTWLDQGARRATILAARTVFAIRAPEALRPAAVTVLGPGDLDGYRRGIGRSASRYVLDSATGRVDGAVLPSRLPTALPTVQVLPQRARLRFARRDDGGLDVLDGAGLAVPRQSGAAVVRRGSAWFVMDASGALRPASEAAGRAAAKGLLTIAIDGPDRPTASGAEFAERLLPPMRGGDLFWALSSEPPPDLDDLGLTVDWSRDVHVIAGEPTDDDFVTTGR